MGGDLTGAILVGAFLFFWAFLYALLEVQTDGAVGWALAFPTWRKQSPWYSRLMSGKELTGYHAIMFLLPIFLMLGTFIFDRYWSGAWRLASLRHAGEMLSWYLMLSVDWDFMWFPLNPYFGIKRFCRGEIRWHRRWIGPIPFDYVGGLVGAAVFTAVVGLFLGAGSGIWFRQLLILGVMLCGTLLAVLIAPAYQRWQKSMRAGHGRLTEDWKQWFTPDEVDALQALLHNIEDARQQIATFERLRARREQLWGNSWREHLGMSPVWLHK